MSDRIYPSGTVYAKMSSSRPWTLKIRYHRLACICPQHPKFAVLQARLLGGFSPPPKSPNWQFYKLNLWGGTGPPPDPKLAVYKQNPWDPKQTAWGFQMQNLIFHTITSVSKWLATGEPQTEPALMKKRHARWKCARTARKNRRPGALSASRQ